MLNTTLPSFRILAVAYVFRISAGDFHIEFMAVSYQVFRNCSDSGYDFQNSLSVLLANILSIRFKQKAKINNKFANWELYFFSNSKSPNHKEYPPPMLFILIRQRPGIFCCFSGLTIITRSFTKNARRTTKGSLRTFVSP